MEIKKRGRKPRELTEKTINEVEEIRINNQIDKAITIDIHGENKYIDFKTPKEERQPRWIGKIDVFNSTNNELEYNVL